MDLLLLQFGRQGHEAVRNGVDRRRRELGIGILQLEAHEVPVRVAANGQRGGQSQTGLVWRGHRKRHDVALGKSARGRRPAPAQTAADRVTDGAALHQRPVFPGEAVALAGGVHFEGVGPDPEPLLEIEAVERRRVGRVLPPEVQLVLPYDIIHDGIRREQVIPPARELQLAAELECLRRARVGVDDVHPNRRPGEISWFDEETAQGIAGERPQHHDAQDQPFEPHDGSPDTPPVGAAAARGLPVHHRRWVPLIRLQRDGRRHCLRHRRRDRQVIRHQYETSSWVVGPSVARPMSNQGPLVR